MPVPEREIAGSCALAVHCLLRRHRCTASRPPTMSSLASHITNLKNSHGRKPRDILIADTSPIPITVAATMSQEIVCDCEMWTRTRIYGEISFNSSPRALTA